MQHYDNKVCTDCHPHRSGFPSFTTVWNNVKRWFADLFTTDSAYAKPPAWVTDGALPPGLANHSLPEQAWENGLKRFKLNFEIIRQSASNENSGQSAIKDDIIYYYHNDHLGTPLFLTDEAGSIVWRREQTPFGVTSYERGTTTENMRFPGQYWDDEKRSSYNGFRDGYDPNLGRYGQADPIGLIIRGNTNNINHLFIYTLDNPILYSDPSGLMGCAPKRPPQPDYTDLFKDSECQKAIHASDCNDVHGLCEKCCRKVLWDETKPQVLGIYKEQCITACETAWQIINEGP